MEATPGGARWQIGGPVNLRTLQPSTGRVAATVEWEQGAAWILAASPSFSPVSPAATRWHYLQFDKLLQKNGIHFCPGRFSFGYAGHICLLDFSLVDLLCS